MVPFGQTILHAHLSSPGTQVQDFDLKDACASFEDRGPIDPRARVPSQVPLSPFVEHAYAPGSGLDPSGEGSILVTGHAMRSMFDRYAITSGDDVRKAMREVTVSR